ncbi:hypothetical protein [Croceibacterium aestuarii]|uniref:hypothetical protein n=1 Tax=Croceibacterium aestuarii TaxID=3064139 RepID=UPI00272EA105|nr:hypothetical protein [Croceibacterium sp. D39]
MRILALPVTALALALAACGSQTDETPAEQPSAAPTPTPLPTEIPAQFQGRWGLSPNDCTTTQGDDKGLLTVDSKTLKFYESVGTLDEVTEATQGRLRGNFSFAGEGMNWKRDEILDLRDDGKVLVRREFGEGASTTPFDYMKCE